MGHTPPPRNKKGRFDPIIRLLIAGRESAMSGIYDVPLPFVPGSLDDPNLIVTEGEGFAPCEWCLIEEQPDKKSDCPGCGHPRKKAGDSYRVRGEVVKPEAPPPDTCIR